MALLAALLGGAAAGCAPTERPVAPVQSGNDVEAVRPLDGPLWVAVPPGDDKVLVLETEPGPYCLAALAYSATARPGRVDVVVRGIGDAEFDGAAVECSGEPFALLANVELPGAAWGAVEIHIRHAGETDMYRYERGTLTAVRSTTTRLWR